MANRYTDTGKWADNDFSKLSLNAKMIYLYILDNCNNAGFYEPNLRLIEFQTGLSSKDILATFEELRSKCIQVDGWIWVRAFLKRQGNFLLKETNNAHKQIIGFIKDQMKRYSCSPEFADFISELTDDIRGLLGATEGLISPPVMYSNVMSSNSSSLKGGVGENFLTAKEINPVLPPTDTERAIFALTEIRGKQDDKPKVVTPFEETKLRGLIEMLGAEKILVAIEKSGSKGWYGTMEQIEGLAKGTIKDKDFSKNGTNIKTPTTEAQHAKGW